MPGQSDLPFELSEALRHVLKKAREAGGLSLGQVAQRSGLNRQAITFIERGERRPTTETFARLSLALRLKPSEVWAEAESRLSRTDWFENPERPDPQAGE